MRDNTFQYVPWATGLWAKAGFEATTNSILLDLGCGVGEAVDQFRQAGYKVWGCDLNFPDDPDNRLRSHLKNGIVKTIECNPYTLPYSDNIFDLVYSFQVFEHVMDYPATLAEIKRVLKPDGMSIHVFPGRWRRRESHVYIPYSSVLKAYWWLKIWALFGIRNEYQIGLSASETAKRNYIYLKEKTNYPTRMQIRKDVTQFFATCRFVEEAHFSVSPQRQWYFQKFPILLKLYRAYYSDTNMRVIVFSNKLSNS